MQYNLIFIPAALIIPIISIVWVCILTQPGNIFSFLGKWLINAPEFIRNPFLDCEVCNAGQIAFWFFVLQYGLNWYIIPFVFITIYLTAFYPKPVINE